MLMMSDFINSINSVAVSNQNKTDNVFADFFQTKIPVSTQISALPNDTVEITTSEDIQEQKGNNIKKGKRIATYCAIVGGLLLLFAAIFKRKRLGEFFSNLFKKKHPNESVPPFNPDSSSKQTQGFPPPDLPSGNSDNLPPLKNGGGNPGAGAMSQILPQEKHYEDISPSEYLSLRHRWETSQTRDEHSAKLGKELNEIEKYRIKNNLTFIPDIPESFADNLEKIDFINTVLNLADKNEASAMDALNVFDKIGGRFEYGTNNYYNTFEDLAIAVDSIAEKLDSDVTDKAISKYLDLFNKFAKKDTESTDTRWLGRFIENHHKKMSEETIIKLIETLKQFSFERQPAWAIRKYIIDSEFSKKTPEQLQRIEQKLRELEEIVKDMPMHDKTRY